MSIFAGIDSPLSFIRYGISRKKEFLRDVRDAFDGLVLPGNVLLYQYKSTPSVVYRCRKPFFVDPMSYLFGAPFEAFKQRVKKGRRFKPSFDRLMRGHGLEPERYLRWDHSQLTNLLLRDRKNLATFVRASLSFQWSRVWDTVKDFEDLVASDDDIEISEEAYRPSFLIPPYFFYQERDHAASELNRRVLEYCRGSGFKNPIYPMVFIRKEEVGEDFGRRVGESLAKTPYSGFCVWVEDFDERYASLEEIKGTIGLIERLHAGGRPVVVLFGGFFHLILHYAGVRCVCEGLAYGQSRRIGASASRTSGPAPIRYYVLQLHRFLMLADALVVLRQRPDLICNCPICRTVLRGDPERVTAFEGQEELAEMHFLYNRAKERELVAQLDRSALVDHLREVHTLNDDISDITKEFKIGPSDYEERPIVDPGYINRWRQAIESGGV